MSEVNPFKKRSVIAYRKKKNLCLLCGTSEEGKEHTCIENYIKADMRGETIPESDVVETHIEEDLEKIKEEARISTIKSYRDRKGLCIECGRVESQEEHDCIPNFDKSDMREESEIDNDPRTIITPKFKDRSIFEQLRTEEINKIFLQNSEDPFFSLEKKYDIRTARPFILLDLTPLATGQKIDASYIQYMVSRYKTHIIYAIGDLSEIYTFRDAEKLRKTLSFCPIRNIADQNIVDHLCQCTRFFGFPSRYLTYCMLHDIKCTVFLPHELDVKSLPCDIVVLDNGKNVSLDTVKRNVISWRI